MNEKVLICFRERANRSSPQVSTTETCIMKDIEAGVNHSHAHQGSEKHRHSHVDGSTIPVPEPARRHRSQVEDPHKKIHEDTTEPSLPTINSSSNGNGGSVASNNNNKSNAAGRPSLDKPPSSTRLLPGIAGQLQKAQQQQESRKDPRLLHPILLRLPLQFRFGMTGVMSNVLFMVAYNSAVEMIPSVQPSIIYAIVYFFFIPASHFMVSLFVFGWPDRYITSLMSNFPIGLTALALGGLLTFYLDQVGFNIYVASYIRDYFSFSYMPPLDARKASTDEEGEFYSSLLVLMVTSLWTYVLSVYVNGPSPRKSQKKEL